MYRVQIGNRVVQRALDYATARDLVFKLRRNGHDARVQWDDEPRCVGCD